MDGCLCTRTPDELRQARQCAEPFAAPATSGADPGRRQLHATGDIRRWTRARHAGIHGDPVRCAVAS
ncbi:hypothetical protein PGTUg99_019512 [Puccinia graminis f. sp. tritici]|uniref:Uncharacterized protein n=1 Tax=Puccinia graminis f. sp. tritici TaxID=56615 RepID=A0A5B0Q197_PUCGR|nr:hypothetical protein PGTUg99_019512 [Puccinia graminis f. sp. tritici]